MQNTTSSAADQSRSTAVHIEVMHDFPIGDRLAEEWKALFDASPTASPPLRWEWLRTWWEIYQGDYAASGADTGLRLFLIRRGAHLIGALPLYLRKSRSLLLPRRLCFISTGEDEHEEICAENLNLLHLPEEGQTCLEALMPALLPSRDSGWDEISLGPITGNSPLAAWSSTDIEGNPAFQSTEHGPCFVADLTGGFEAYLQRLSSNSRKLARKRLNGAERAGARLEVATDRLSALAMLGEVSALHQARWESVGEPGCFAAPRFLAFHKAMLEQGVENGFAVVAKLVCEGETVAAMLGYLAGNKFDSYAAGAKLNDDEPVMSPGIVLHLLLKTYLSERGISYYDHLSGTMRYKQQYATEERSSLSLYRQRPTLRSAANSAFRLLHKAGRHGINLTKSKG